MAQPAKHAHQNTLDAKLNTEQRNAVEHMIATYNLTGLQISWIAGKNSLQFAKDRRVVTIPWPLYAAECWTDIRYLFRAILDSAPAVTNRGAPNDWSPIVDPVTEPSTREQK